MTINHPSYSLSDFGSYSVETGAGGEITTGIGERTARKVAQETANERGESMFIFHGGKSEEIKPAAADDDDAEAVTHQHTPYSHHGDTFRCACGAVAPSGAGPWADNGTRGCATCAAPTTRESGLCAYHELITADGIDFSAVRAKARTIDAGEYLLTYEDSGLTDAEDPTSRCGLDDAQWSELAAILSRRDLKTVTDDNGHMVVVA